MDAFAFHPYPETSATGPALAHPAGTSIGLADYPKLVSLLGTAFDGTAQRGQALPILYDEFGIETPDPAGQGGALLRHRARDHEAGRRGDAGGDADAGDADDLLPADRARPDALPRPGRARARRLAVGRVLRRRLAQGVARPRAPGCRQRAPRGCGDVSRHAPDAEGGDLCVDVGQEGRERLTDMLTRLLLHRLPRRPPAARYRGRTRAEVDPLEGSAGAGQASRHRSGRRPRERRAGLASHPRRSAPTRRAARTRGLREQLQAPERAEADGRRGRRRRQVGARPGRPDAGGARRRLPRHRAQRPLGARRDCGRRPASAPARGERRRSQRRSQPVLFVYQLSSNTPLDAGPPLGVRGLRRDARPQAAGRANGDRRQRAQPQPLLAAPVRAGRKRCRRDRLRAAARRDLRRAEAGRLRPRGRRRRPRSARLGRPERVPPDPLADPVHPRPRPRVPSERSRPSADGRLLAPPLRGEPSRAADAAPPAHDLARHRRLPQAGAAARTRVRRDRPAWLEATRALRGVRGRDDHPAGQGGCVHRAARWSSRSTPSTQARYYAEAIRLARRQPTVAGIYIFHVVDETRLEGLQSGVRYADGTPKASLEAVRRASLRP